MGLLRTLTFHLYRKINTSIRYLRLDLRDPVSRIKLFLEHKHVEYFETYILYLFRSYVLLQRERQIEWSRINPLWQQSLLDEGLYRLSLYKQKTSRNLGNIRNVIRAIAFLQSFNISSDFVLCIVCFIFSIKAELIILCDENIEIIED